MVMERGNFYRRALDHLTEHEWVGAVDAACRSLDWFPTIRQLLEYASDVPPESAPNLTRGYREPGEPRDDRPLVKHRPFWRDIGEQLTYQIAVESNPKKPGEGIEAYLQRICAAAGAKLQGAALKDMPRLPYKEPE